MSGAGEPTRNEMLLSYPWKYPNDEVEVEAAFPESAGAIYSSFYTKLAKPYAGCISAERREL